MVVCTSLNHFKMKTSQIWKTVEFFLKCNSGANWGNYFAMNTSECNVFGRMAASTKVGVGEMLGPRDALAGRNQEERMS